MIRLPRSSPVELDDEAAHPVITIAAPPSSVFRIPSLLVVGAITAVWLIQWCRFSHHIFFVMPAAKFETYLTLFGFSVAGMIPLSIFVNLLFDTARGPLPERLTCYEHDLDYDSGVPPLMVQVESLPPSHPAIPMPAPLDRGRRQVTFSRSDLHTLTLRDEEAGSSLTLCKDGQTIELARFSDEIGRLWLHEYLTKRYLRPVVESSST